jgi:arabinogalactan endo-1,4-beta-galactosidase
LSILLKPYYGNNLLLEELHIEINKMIDIFNKFTDKDIEKFNFAISGSKKMCPQYRIYVHLRNAERIEFHTCFFTMDIYISNIQKIDFDIISQSMLVNNSSFNFA